MKLIVQRVSQASVVVDGACVGAVGAGFMVLVGCRFDDAERDAEHLAAKLAALRIFEDENDKMNLSILDMIFVCFSCVTISWMKITGYLL